MARGSINKVIVIGTTGRVPEMRYLPNGNAVASLSLATDEGYKDRNTGQQVDKTEWHRVEAFGRLAEIIGEYVKKGAKLYIEGKLRTDEYEKDGIKRYSTKIIVHEMTMLDSKGADSRGGYQENYNHPQAQPAQAAPNQANRQPAPQPQPHGGALHPQAAPGFPQQAPATPSNAFDAFDDDVPF